MPGEGAEDRLTVGSDVVGAAHEHVEPDVLENREQLAHRRAHVPAPHGRARLRIARRAEVARGNTSSVELLGGEPPLDEIDERLAEALVDRPAEEEMPGLELDRQVGAEWREESPRVDPCVITTDRAAKRPSVVSSTQAGAAGTTASTVARRTSSCRAIAAIAARGLPMYPSSAQYEPPAREVVSRPGTSFPASTGDTSRDGTPAAFWTRTAAASRSSTGSLCARRYPQEANTSGPGASSRSSAVVHEARDSRASRQCPSATPATLGSTTDACATGALEERSARAIESPTMPAPTTRTSDEGRNRGHRGDILAEREAPDPG